MNSAVSILFVVSLAVLSVQHTEARPMAIRGATTSAASAAAIATTSSSASSNSLQHRRMLARTQQPAEATAALPADAYVVASPCPATASAAPGSRATAVFTVGASLNAEQFKEVALQVDFPKALWPTARLSCQTASSKAITCDAPEPSAEDVAKYDIVSTACLLGDLAETGPVTCSLTYTIPATPLPASIDARQILGAITYAPLAGNVVEDNLNNAATTCVASVPA